MYFDKEIGIQVRLFDLHSTKNETARTITDLVKEVLEKQGLIEKLVAFVADNTNTNFGGLKRKGEKNVLQYLENEINPNIVGVGCPAHMLHNAVHQGLDQFEIFDIDTLVFKIYSYFSIYIVRTYELKDFCDFVEIEFRQLLNHI